MPFFNIRRGIRNSPDRAGHPPEAETSRPGRAAQQRSAAIDSALRPRRSGNEGAAQPSPSRPRGHNLFAALISPLRSPRHHAAERAAAQAGSSRPEHAHAPLTIAQDVEQWRRAAERDLPNMRADFGQYAMDADDIRPAYLQETANAVARAAEQRSPRLAIKDLPAASLPQSIGRLPHLEELSILGSECTELPDSIGNLANLTRLVLGRHDQVKHLPDRITGLDKLTTLQATAMPLEALPQGIGNLRRLTVLRLSGGRYEHLPQEFTNLSALKELQLSHTKPRRQGGQGLQALPDDFGRLRSLENLNLSGHQSLRTIPDSLTALDQLQVLNLADCPRVTELPRDLGRLQSLKLLRLSDNTGLRTLPESLCNLTRLEELDLARCKNLQALPREIGNLRQLQKLDLSGCTSLRELPASLARLPARCEIIVPVPLQAQLHQLRPPRRHAAQPAGPGGEAARPLFRPRPAALPARPARRIHLPRQVANPQVAAWKERLAPFAREEGAHRFSQWMDAIGQHGEGRLSDRQAAQMERIVQAACTSPALRGKLNTFATEHVHLQRDNETGMTMTHIPPATFAGVDAAHHVFVAHMVSDPQLATPDAAYALLGEAVQERFGRMAPDQAIRQMAGSEPTGPRPDRFSVPPWPALVAYVQAHDPEGRRLAASGVAQLETLHELSDLSGPSGINQNEMLRGYSNVQGANNLLMHERMVAVATELLTYRSIDRSPTINPALR